MSNRRRVGWRWLLVLASFPLASLGAREAARNWWYGLSGPDSARIAAPTWVQDVRSQFTASSATLSSATNSGILTTSADKAARALLLSRPLTAMALRQVGFVAELKREGSGLLSLHLAERVSRRDLATQLALIEHSALKGDAIAALRHYDRALSVQPDADAQLFPVLARALGHEDIRQGLTAYIQRPWFTRFVYRALALGADPAAFGALVNAAGSRLDTALRAQLTSETINSLIDQEDFAAARRFASSLRNVPAGILDQAGFSQAAYDPRLGVLGWQLADNETVSANAANSGEIALMIASNRSGEVARRLTLLSQGTYRIRQRLIYENDVPRARLTWEVRCVGNTSKPVLWREVMPAENGIREAKLEVPAGCSGQSWRLQATSALSQFPSEAALASLTVMRDRPL